ncbi:MAG: putative Indolepyruvate oxidoreductase subunit IorB [Promethearchaeota archaeon]|nr:MAG: putative Indolepyruvate oxidoreductase subunit IorB [Candidatus Lokiarchaeota archaeon]
MADIFNILVAGVGGQGAILLGNLLRTYGLNSPLIKNVVGTETRGVSQREGSVMATARYLIESRVYQLDQGYEKEDLISPTIPMNDAHLVLGLEPLETLRNLKYISEQSVVVINTHKRFPRDVILKKEGSKQYPSMADIVDLLDQFARRTISMDFNKISKSEYDNAIYANTIILGVAAKEFENIFLNEKLIEIIKKNLKPVEINISAFELGYSLI